MKYLLNLVCMFIGGIAFAQNPWDIPPSQIMIFQNMPGENEIVKVAPLDAIDTYSRNSSRVIFAGTVMDNNQKKIMIGRAENSGTSLIWVKMITIDSLENIIDLSKLYNTDLDTSFIVTFNTDTTNGNNKIGAIEINKSGVIQWAKYYSSDSAILLGNSFGFRNSGSLNRYTMVGGAKHASYTRALMFGIDTTTGAALNSSESMIRNSNYQIFEFIDRSIWYHPSGGGSTQLPHLGGVSGVFNNGVYGKDVFLGSSIFQYMGDQFNSRTSVVAGGATSARAFIVFQNDNNRIGYLIHSNSDPYGWWGNPNRQQFPNKIRMVKHGFADAELNSVIGINFFDKSIGMFNVRDNYYENIYAVPNSEIELNDFLSVYYSGPGNSMTFHHLVGKFGNSALPYKTSYFGEFTIFQGCLDKLTSLTSAQIISNWSFPDTFLINPINVISSDIVYSEINLYPILISVCVPIPMLKDSINFSGPSCENNVAKVKLTNVQNDFSITATLNGFPLIYSPSDSSLDLTGLLSAPSDTLHILYQGLFYSSFKDTIIDVAYVFTISPNPFNDEFTIHHDESLKEIVITDVYGNIIKRIKVLDKTKTVINLKGCAFGIYFVKGDLCQAVKIVKE